MLISLSLGSKVVSQKESAKKHELLSFAIIFIIVGGVIWSVTWPASVEETANSVGQVVFYIGLAFIVCWAAIRVLNAVRSEYAERNKPAT